ncbi:MAG: CPBP family intramembrane metalloprotease [Myxococcota bacterium]|nr:CPBP family intramembrane metalloprotease [Myxococcota bacterium]
MRERFVRARARARDRDRAPGARAPSGGLVLGLFAAQLGWLVLAAGAASELGVDLARVLAFSGGALALALAGVLPRPRSRDALEAACSAAVGWALVPALALVFAGLATWAAPLPVGAHPPGHRGALHLLGVAGLGPVCEEWLFRGVLFAWLGARLGARLGGCLGGAGALLGSSVAFGLWHGLGPHGVVAAAVGLLLGGLRLSGTGIAGCAGVHAGLNLGLLSGGLPPDGHALSAAGSATLALPGLALLFGLGRVRRGTAHG